PGTTEEALACVEAEVDMFICGGGQLKAVRAGAPHTFITAGVALHTFPTDDDTMRAAFETIEAGADAIYTPRRPEFAKLLADEGIPVMGHLGLVPRKSTWYGGLRAVGKTADEAMMLYDQFRRLEDAGAFAVEVEVIPEQLLAELTKRTSLVTISLGSGSSGDVQYLFMVDICGDNDSMPRHAKAYGNLSKLRKQMHEERVAAVKAFRSDIYKGSFPDKSISVQMDEKELDIFRNRLEASTHV
ncbi:MAG: 3-methyl-2-oxobutanoate hydroxymethyltransferase, partial [Chloroflexota bacterium]